MAAAVPAAWRSQRAILALSAGAATAVVITARWATTASASAAIPKRRLLVLAGPSGVGKGTLIEKLRAEFPRDFGVCVSHTTRDPRPGEQDGVAYNFVAKPDMQASIARGEFLEYAEIHGKTMYGTSLAAIPAACDEGAGGKICIFDIDIQGCKAIDEKWRRVSSLPPLQIFILPPSVAGLEARLRGRGTETDEQVDKRMATAKGELAFYESTEGQRIFNDSVVNADLEQAYAELKAQVEKHLEWKGGR